MINFNLIPILDPTKKSLFVQSGWVKRLNELCNLNISDEEFEKKPKSFRESTKMIRELIGHKVKLKLLLLFKSFLLRLEI